MEFKYLEISAYQKDVDLEAFGLLNLRNGSVNSVELSMAAACVVVEGSIRGIEEDAKATRRTYEPSIATLRVERRFSTT
jgi:hypothetical protein